VTTEARRTSDEYGVFFTAFFDEAKIAHADVKAIVIASVVPQVERYLYEACRRYFACEPIPFSATRQRLMEVRIERPAELGADLIAGAIGAVARYGAPVIVLDYGTATTFAAISRDGAYLGTAIAPGIEISVNALVARAAKLPQIVLEAPPESIGRETIASLQSGIVFGFVGQAEAIIARMKAELGGEARVVATGGLAEIVARHTSVIETVEPHLVLEGLRLYYDSLS
jgi:type III pantothenate kinase